MIFSFAGLNFSTERHQTEAKKTELPKPKQLVVKGLRECNFKCYMVCLSTIFSKYLDRVPYFS